VRTVCHNERTFTIAFVFFLKSCLPCDNLLMNAGKEVESVGTNSFYFSTDVQAFFPLYDHDAT
jgi:hypothetical protein